MNWYVLYVMTLKSEKLVAALNKKADIEAFIPRLEYYRRDRKAWETKPMCNGYIFVKSSLPQVTFDEVLQDIPELRDGMIRQLKYSDASALRAEEIALLEALLDEEYVIRLSYAYIENGRAVVYKGPLQAFEQHIVKLDKHNHIAYLDVECMARQVQASVMITGKI